LRLQEQRSLQRLEEALEGLGVLDGPQVELRARAHHRLRLVALAHRDRRAHQVGAVMERSPGQVGLGEQQGRIVVVGVVARVGPVLALVGVEALAGDDAQFLVEHLDHETEVLQRGDHGGQDAHLVGRGEHARLSGAQRDLALFRQPDLVARVRQSLVPRLERTEARGEQQHESRRPPG